MGLYLFTFISCFFILVSTVHSREYTIKFKNSLRIIYGGDPACDCSFPEESYFIDQATGTQLYILDMFENTLKKYYTLTKTWEGNEGSSTNWTLKKKYKNKLFFVNINYERCREPSEECQNNSSTYNNILKSIYQY